MKGCVVMKNYIKRNFKRTWKNKICSVVMLLLGILSAVISDDATALVMIFLFFVVPLWVAKDNIMM